MHFVSVNVDKHAAIRVIPVERNEMVIQLALHGTFTQGYGRLNRPQYLAHTFLRLLDDLNLPALLGRDHKEDLVATLGDKPKFVS